MSNIFQDIIKVFDGGTGSGNFGHAGRKGKVGGSQPDPDAVNKKNITKVSNDYKTYVDSEVLTNPDAHSLGKYLDDKGNLKPERKQLHKDIIQKQFEGVKKTDKPVIYFNGGGTASGKSSIGALLPDVPNEKNKQGVVVDPDTIKKLLPEYKEMVNEGNSNAAAYNHEESSMIAKQILRLALNSNRYNTLVDGTLGGRLESTRNKIRAAKATGNPVIGNFVTVDYDEALKRSYLRYLKTGRFPNIDDTLKIHRNVSNNFSKLFSEFDSGKLIDNNGKTPKVIAEFENGKLVVKDRKAYNNFINKKNLTDEEMAKIKNRFKKKIDEYNREWLAKPENKGKKLRKLPDLG